MGVANVRTASLSARGTSRASRCASLRGAARYVPRLVVWRCAACRNCFGAGAHLDVGCRTRSLNRKHRPAGGPVGFRACRRTISGMRKFRRCLVWCFKSPADGMPEPGERRLDSGRPPCRHRRAAHSVSRASRRDAREFRTLDCNAAAGLRTPSNHDERADWLEHQPETDGDMAGHFCGSA